MIPARRPHEFRGVRALPFAPLFPMFTKPTRGISGHGLQQES